MLRDDQDSIRVGTHGADDPDGAAQQAYAALRAAGMNVRSGQGSVVNVMKSVGDRLAQLKAEAGLAPGKSLIVDYSTTISDGKGLPPDACYFKALVRKALKGYGSLNDKEKGALEKALVQKAAMAEQTGATGGYTIPPEYQNTLFQTIAEQSIFWPRCPIIPMGSLETLLPVPNFTTAQVAGTTAMFGGLLFKFGQGATGNEGVAITETEPTFGQLVLHSWDLIGQAIASVQYIEDLLAREDGEERLLTLFGQAAAYYADYNFFRGTGASQAMPLGVVNAPCALVVSRTSSAHVAAADVAAMTKKLLPASWKTAIWCCGPDVLLDLFQITAFQPNENPEQAPDGFCGFLYTRPVFCTEKLPAIGVQGDITLFDPALYVIGDRQQPEVAASKEEPSVFRNNQMMFRTWMRVDGKPLLANPVTLVDGTRTASSVVVLETK